MDSNSDCVADVPGSVRIGEKCRVFAHLYTQNEGKITIGDHTCIYGHTVIGSVSEISIGSCVIISNHVHIYDNNNHPTSPEVRKQMCLEGFEGAAWRWDKSASAPITICDNVWIGEYSAIMKGVTVGEGSIVAAHSVVTKDVPPYSIVAGNPARVVKSLES
ncbi:MAG: acyltransferase [Clostridia bacterium]|nr:acyltransferase [Clostridia bacterium]